MTLSKKRSAAIAAFFLAALLIAVAAVNYFTRNENLDFEAYTHALFCREVSGDTISLHYTLKNPSAYGITDTPVSLGSYCADTTSACAALENALAVLHSYDRRRLSQENRLTYDILKDSYETALALAPYALYQEPLSPLTGTQAQLPVVLSEYQFYSTSDIDTYLELLTKVPAYFQSVLALETRRAEAGLFMSSEALDQLTEECFAFTRSGENHYLYTSFEERLDSLERESGEKKLSSSTRKQYIKRNRACLKTYVFPAYETLAKELEALRGSSETSGGAGGLCSLPGGKRYYELLTASETGSSRSIPKLQELARRQILEDLGDMQSALARRGIRDASEHTDSVSSDLFAPQGVMLHDSNPVSILSSLEQKMNGDFPEPPAVDVQIKYVQESLQEYLSPAFYMIPALDNTESNVIYINAGHIPDDLSLFTTLAHEGYPGHLYQNVYYMNQSPDPIRCLMNYGGYTEGWATYSEMLSYYYAPIPKEDAAILQKNTSILLGLYALADMGIHYDGWTLSETIEFFSDHGIQDPAAVSEIYRVIVSDPANYLKYYIGYLEFLELKKYAIETWGEDFSQERFHRTVLETGPAPFPILRKQIAARR